MQGLIIKLIAGDYTVYANNQTYLCKARGIFRNINMLLFVGIYVTLLMMKMDMVQ